MSPSTIPEEDGNREEGGDAEADVEVVISPPSPERNREKEDGEEAEGRLPTPPPE